MTAVLGYINYRDNYDLQNPYFIFKDETTGDYYRYELLMQNIGDGSKAKRIGEDEEEKRSYRHILLWARRDSRASPPPTHQP